MDATMTRRSALKVMGAAALCALVPGALAACSSETTWYNFETRNKKRQANRLVLDSSKGMFTYYEGSERDIYGSYSASGTSYTFVDASSSDKKKYTGQIKNGDLYAFNRIWHTSEQEAVQAYNAGIITYH